jgi:hypothetical protein
MLGGATPAEAAEAGGNTVINGAVSGLSVKGGTVTYEAPKVEATLDSALANVVHKSTNVAAASFVGAGATAVTGVGAPLSVPLAVTGAASSLVAAGASLVQDAVEYAGLSNKQEGMIHGLAAVAKPYMEVAEQKIKQLTDTGAGKYAALKAQQATDNVSSQQAHSTHTAKAIAPNSVVAKTGEPSTTRPMQTAKRVTGMNGLALG